MCPTRAPSRCLWVPVARITTWGPKTGPATYRGAQCSSRWMCMGVRKVCCYGGVRMASRRPAEESWSCVKKYITHQQLACVLLPLQRLPGSLVGRLPLQAGAPKVWRVSHTPRVASTSVWSNACGLTSRTPSPHVPHPYKPLYSVPLAHYKAAHQPLCLATFCQHISAVVFGHQAGNPL